MLKHIKTLKLKEKLSDCSGGTLLLIAMSFLPILIIIALLGVQFANYSATFRQSREDIQTYYVAEMGIERYKNEIKDQPSYNSVLTFQKIIDGKTYNVQVTMIKDGSIIVLSSNVLGTNITVQREITKSRI